MPLLSRNKSARALPSVEEIQREKNAKINATHLQKTGLNSIFGAFRDALSITPPTARITGVTTGGPAKVAQASVRPQLTKQQLQPVTSKKFEGTRFEPLFIPTSDATIHEATGGIVCECEGKTYIPNPKYIAEGRRPQMALTADKKQVTLSTASMKPTSRWPTTTSTPAFEAYKLDQSRMLSRHVENLIHTPAQGKAVLAALRDEDKNGMSGLKDSGLIAAIQKDPALGREVQVLQALNFSGHEGEIALLKTKQGEQVFAGLAADGKLVVKEFMVGVDPKVQGRCFANSLMATKAAPGQGTDQMQELAQRALEPLEEAESLAVFAH